MRWMVCVAAMAITGSVWAEGRPAEEKLEDPTAAIQSLEQEQASCRDRLNDINTQLDENRLAINREQDPETKASLISDMQGLHEKRNTERVRLGELTAQLEIRRARQLRLAFGEECDLVLADAAVGTVNGVHLTGMVDVAGRRMLQFQSKGVALVWTIDPQRIVLVKVTAPAAAEVKPEK